MEEEYHPCGATDLPYKNAGTGVVGPRGEESNNITCKLVTGCYCETRDRSEHHYAPDAGRAVIALKGAQNSQRTGYL